MSSVTSTKAAILSTMYFTDMGYSLSRLAIMGYIAIPGWAACWLALAWQARFRCWVPASGAEA
jgi:hypothetical protein